MDSNNQLYKKIGILISIVAVLAILIIAFKNDNNSSVPDNTNTVVNTTDASGASSTVNTPDTSIPSTNNATGSANTPDTNVTAPSKSIYKNGTYSAVGTYEEPDGQASIKVTLTIQNDIVTSADVVSASGDRTSVRYQNKFISGYKQYVVGKKITDINIKKVSGSSLTPDGFNKALESIKTQAKA